MTADPQPAFVPRKPQGDFPARDDLGYEQHMQQQGRGSVQNNVAEVAPNKPENEIITQPSASSLNGQMSVQSALVTQPNQMSSQLVPSSSTSSAIEGPINAEGPYSVFVDESVRVCVSMQGFLILPLGSLIYFALHS